MTQTENDSCGEGCAQLDDFKWFLPADERAGDLTAPESEIEVSDSKSEVEYIEPDSTLLQTETPAQQLLCPPVVAQTRPIEGCNPACVPTVVTTLAAAPQAASEVVQPRPRDYSCTDLLPPVGECLESLGIDTPDAGGSGMEVAGGSPPADMDISVVPDVLQTAVSVTTEMSKRWIEIYTPDPVKSGMKVAGGSPPADIDISMGPDVLPTAVSVTTEVSEQ